MYLCNCRHRRSYGIGINRKVYFSSFYKSFYFASSSDFTGKVYKFCSDFKFLIALNNLSLNEKINNIEFSIGVSFYEIYFRLDVYNMYLFNHYSLNYNSLHCNSCQQNTYYIDSRLVDLDEQTKQDIINEYYIRNL